MDDTNPVDPTTSAPENPATDPVAPAADPMAPIPEAPADDETPAA